MATLTESSRHTAGISDELVRKAQAARRASRLLARATTEQKNQALERVAVLLESRANEIIAANTRDYAAGQAEGLSDVLLDRLLLNEERVHGMAADVRATIHLPDPVGEEFDASVLPNGLRVCRRRVPLGVIAAVYESRPNVTIDIAALCIKSGNAVILRGGKEAFNSSTTLAGIVREALDDAGLPADAAQIIETTDRAIVGQMLTYEGGIDLLIPRGSDTLIRFVRDNARIPVVTGGIGVCHTYVDASVDIEQAVAIAYNAKVQRPTVCNALDTLLVHAHSAPQVLPAVIAAWAQDSVEVHADSRALALIGPEPPTRVIAAVEDDWGREFLSLTAAVKIVDSLDEALEHITEHGSGHTEAILTADDSNAARFLDEVDAAAVIVNASSRFTDGAQLGLGAEVAISTNKLHARGPMGLRELTSYKWTIMGDGQTRA